MGDPYHPKNAVRFITAASLFDGHDATINIIRRVLLRSGAEVVHLGHNRSVAEVAHAAVQEDAQGVAVSSYQGGHMEYFAYLRRMLDDLDAGHVRIFAGGGGVIVADEKRDLESRGICRVFSPDDGRALGLQGMIDEMLRACDFPTVESLNGELSALSPRNWPALARAVTWAESGGAVNDMALPDRPAPVLGVAGTGGAGKSSLVDELVQRFAQDNPDVAIAILSVDPTRRATGGALLGDRIRMNAIERPAVFMRSLATREPAGSLSAALGPAVRVARAAGFDLIIVESSGIGQADTSIVDLADLALYVMTAEYGAATQLEKIGMLDYADLVAINKFERRGALDALREVRKTLQRNRAAFDARPEDMPVYPTIASHFADPGVDNLYVALVDLLRERHDFKMDTGLARQPINADHEPPALLPPARSRYLSEIAQGVREYHRRTDEAASNARLAWQLRAAAGAMDGDARETLLARAAEVESGLPDRARALLEDWAGLQERYAGGELSYTVRGRERRAPLVSTSLSGKTIARVSLPRFEDHGERLNWLRRENVPGAFPYTAGVFPLKRQGEDPTRMFAGEGPPEATNRRFHYLSAGMPAKRLSTAFDSVTLYGEDPAERPDIFGKIGESGVSICTVLDMEKLYAGFDLADPATSVSMTINGPAPAVLAFFMNAAVRQQARRFLRENGRLAIPEGWELYPECWWAGGAADPDMARSLPEGTPARSDARDLPAAWEQTRALLSDAEYADIHARTLAAVRGTVQADILKEDQAQNTCIFSTEFALRMMGDVQAYFVDRGVRNFYSVSISGYHIAEAGANPITQLAFTLANGFTLVEYYRARGMDVDAFAPNLSFFFSNGLDPEYAVIGRVARRIWAVAMRDVYGASERSQKLKYHIQTSGRSLHAQEIEFNDIRTTLQALLAIADNTNSLHTNAYDEAITTPTEESVRRAVAIQMIINHELGIARNENPWQGSFFIEQLTDMVEAAVLEEFDRLSERGGVLGAMELQYQRSRIQEESLAYEEKKMSGELPIIGVNTWFKDGDPESSKAPENVPLSRSTDEEKRARIDELRRFQEQHARQTPAALKKLQDVARAGGNTFEVLMDTVQHASLGQITGSLYEVGGRYRRSM